MGLFVRFQVVPGGGEVAGVVLAAIAWRVAGWADRYGDDISVLMHVLFAYTTKT